jgi:hypothetical protein
MLLQLLCLYLLTVSYVTQHCYTALLAHARSSFICFALKALKGFGLVKIYVPFSGLMFFYIKALSRYTHVVLCLEQSVLIPSTGKPPSQTPAFHSVNGYIVVCEPSVNHLVRETRFCGFRDPEALFKVIKMTISP